MHRLVAGREHQPGQAAVVTGHAPAAQAAPAPKVPTVKAVAKIYPHFAGGEAYTSTFDEVYVMTGGGPGTATSVPAYQIWSRLFRTGEVGSAAALGIVLMLIVVAVTFVINRLMERGAGR